MSFSQNLYNLMQNKKTSSYKLARNIDVHVSTVTNWLNGATPRMDHMKAVATYFDVTIDSLLKE